jgi:hypothetical protein
MPIPKPNPSEKGKKGRQKFVSRCMEAIKDDKRPQAQKLAICFTTYKNAKRRKVAKGSVEEPDWDVDFEDKNSVIIP